MRMRSDSKVRGVLQFPCFLGSIVSPAHKWFYCDHASGDYNINTYSAPFRSGLLYMPIANTHAYTSTTPQSENHHIKAIYNTKKTFKQKMFLTVLARNELLK